MPAGAASCRSAGGAFNLTGRYLQYRASLQTTDSGLSPTLRSVTLSYGAAPVDNTPPTITARTPLNNATNVTIGSSVSATFSEPMDAATITPASVTLRAAGAGSDVPATVSYAGGVASLVPNAPLAYNTVYTATVAASVADLAGNQLGTAASWSFTTEPAPLSTLTDTSLADFGAGSVSNTYLADESGGEVTLAPTVGAEFGGSALPAGWTQAAPVDQRRTSPSAAAAGRGRRQRRTTALRRRGRRSNFVATFGARHISTSDSVQTSAIQRAMGHVRHRHRRRTAYLRVRTHQPGCPLGAGLPARPTATASSGTPTAFEFYVDGSAVPAATLPSRHDAPDRRQRLHAGGPRWRRLDAMSPYPAAGSFTSRVFDAGSTVGWQQLTADELHPVNTSLGFEVRSGNVAVPDASWSSFVPVSWRRLQPDRPLPAVPRQPADHRQRAEPDPAQRDRQLWSATSQPRSDLRPEPGRPDRRRG